MTPVPVVVAKNIKIVVGDDRMNRDLKNKLAELKERFDNLSDLL